MGAHPFFKDRCPLHCRPVGLRQIPLRSIGGGLLCSCERVMVVIAKERHFGRRIFSALPVIGVQTPCYLIFVWGISVPVLSANRLSLLKRGGSIDSNHVFRHHRIYRSEEKTLRTQN